MGKLKNILIVLILIIFTLAGSGSKVESDRQLTEEEKIEDFEYLYKVIVENYPFLEVNKRVNNTDWIGKKEDYLRIVKQTKSDRTYLTTLNRILGGLSNGHTHMLTSKEDVQLLRNMYSMNNGCQKEVQLKVLNNEKALKRYEIDLNEKIEVLEQKENNEIIQIKNARVKDVIEDKVAYIEIPNMIPYYSMEEDIKLLDEYLEKVKDYSTLIIDIRGNRGGDAYYWWSYLIPKIISKPHSSSSYSVLKDGEVIEEYLKDSLGEKIFSLNKVEDLEIENLPNIPEEVMRDFKYYFKSDIMINPNKDSINFKGNIYLLVDKYVYSSSESLAVFSKDSGFATLVGEKTGGDGIGSDPLIHMLPNSGYLFRFSKDMGLTSDGTCNEEFKTEPHYIVENANKNSNFSEDLVIKKVLELEGINVE